MNAYLNQLITGVVDVLHKAGPLEVVDVLVVAIVMYQILKLVRGTRAAELLVGLVLLGLLGAIAISLNLVLLSWFFTNAAPFIAIGVLVLFQPELRRALDQVGRLSHLNIPLAPFNPQLFNRGVGEAVRAIERLAVKHTGALIAFERKVGLEDYASTGIRVNGELTAEFLQTIFFPNSPLHDGAVIVRGNAIVAAGCLLPMPEEGRVRERYGTRHRAALGLSMVSDAIVVVVSEETGQISVAEDGKIQREIDPEALRARMLRMTPVAKPKDGRSRMRLGFGSRSPR